MKRIRKTIILHLDFVNRIKGLLKVKNYYILFRIETGFINFKNFICFNFDIALFR